MTNRFVSGRYFFTQIYIHISCFYTNRLEMFLVFLWKRRIPRVHRVHTCFLFKIQNDNNTWIQRIRFGIFAYPPSCVVDRGILPFAIKSLQTSYNDLTMHVLVVIIIILVNVVYGYRYSSVYVSRSFFL